MTGSCVHAVRYVIPAFLRLKSQRETVTPSGLRATMHSITSISPLTKRSLPSSRVRCRCSRRISRTTGISRCHWRSAGTFHHSTYCQHLQPGCGFHVACCKPYYSYNVETARLIRMGALGSFLRHANRPERYHSIGPSACLPRRTPAGVRIFACADYRRKNCRGLWYRMHRICGAYVHGGDVARGFTARPRDAVPACVAHLGYSTGLLDR